MAMTIRKKPIFLRSAAAVGALVLFQATAAPGKPDPKPDLALTIESSADVAFLETITITVTVKNRGTAPSPEAECELIVRKAVPPRRTLKKYEKKIRILDPGDSFSYSIPLKPGLGQYEVCATVDPKKKIPEEDEENNGSCVKIVGK